MTTRQAPGSLRLDERVAVTACTARFGPRPTGRALLRPESTLRWWASECRAGRLVPGARGPARRRATTEQRLVVRRFLADNGRHTGAPSLRAAWGKRAVIPGLGKARRQWTVRAWQGRADRCRPLRDGLAHRRHPLPEPPHRFLSDDAITTCIPDDERLRASFSYPSGHAALGFGWALVLAEVIPSRADAIIARGRDFGWSRVVCGVHYPSDIDAGRTVAAAAVARLHADPEFQRLLNAAREELARAYPN